MIREIPGAVKMWLNGLKDCAIRKSNAQEEVMSTQQ